MKSEKPKIIEMFDKLPKVISSCENQWQLVYAQRWVHLAFKKYPESMVLRILGEKLIRDRSKKINAYGK